ncbi:MAG: hypothetical protein ACRDDZ_07405 [Marinifilaceae bacterium]
MNKISSDITIHLFEIKTTNPACVALSLSKRISRASLFRSKRLEITLIAPPQKISQPLPREQ